MAPRRELANPDQPRSKALVQVFGCVPICRGGGRRRSIGDGHHARAIPVTPRRVVVIGAGLGGLSSAALLARAGHDVTVIDKNDWIGGKSRRIEVAGQRIDTGPSLITFPA
ncbi:MAG: FAD-dependent oxidoreductase, partial [Actinobacteria bacterium]|nr:FAD-dependent oxidoreductase [Actinomycetota bacterium]